MLSLGLPPWWQGCSVNMDGSALERSIVVCWIAQVGGFPLNFGEQAQPHPQPQSTVHTSQPHPQPHSHEHHPRPQAHPQPQPKPCPSVSPQTNLLHYILAPPDSTLTPPLLMQPHRTHELPSHTTQRAPAPIHLPCHVTH